MRLVGKRYYPKSFLTYRWRFLGVFMTCYFVKYILNGEITSGQQFLDFRASSLTQSTTFFHTRTAFTEIYTQLVSFTLPMLSECLDSSLVISCALFICFLRVCFGNELSNITKPSAVRLLPYVMGSICIWRFKLQYISLKAASLNEFFKWVRSLVFSTAYTPNFPLLFLIIYSFLFTERFVYLSFAI